MAAVVEQFRVELTLLVTMLCTVLGGFIDGPPLEASGTEQGLHAFPTVPQMSSTLLDASSLCFPLPLCRYDPKDFETTEFVGDFAGLTPPHVLARVVAPASLDKVSTFTHDNSNVHGSALVNGCRRRRRIQRRQVRRCRPIPWSLQIPVTHHCFQEVL